MRPGGRPAYSWPRAWAHLGCGPCGDRQTDEEGRSDEVLVLRLLIYAMQSSGASTLAFLLAQKPACVAFVDVWAQYAAPELPYAGDDVLAKVVVTTTFPLGLHQRRFRPDRTLLFLRHPAANYRSLATKPYRHHCGFIEEKFAMLERIFRKRAMFDATIYYEDLVFDPLGTLRAVTALGWSCESNYLNFTREPSDIKRTNEGLYPSIIGRLEYGFGQHHPGQLAPQYVDLTAAIGSTASVNQLCPTLVRHYSKKVQERRMQWGLASAECHG